MSIKGKVALVTGAYRGIGLVIAEELARQGAKVASSDISPEFAEAISERFQEQGLSGHGFCLDVGNQESIDNAIAEITKIYGVAPQILINNAGITRDNLLMRMSDAEWDMVINTNLTSVFRLTRSCIRSMMKERWGKIVNIASVVGVTGNAGQVNYTAAKAGVIALTKSVAKEVGSRNITVNAIAPGFIESAMTQKLTDEQREKYLANIPLARAGKPEDIANAVSFLVSDAASYITGTTLHVNGGMYMN
ncbi:MAG: 3-oxoacyl-[acyl-carrier-protein] reductase [Gammaproteobacteria bacterium GWE2_37_16]|nr:MAG: 3-oxoacyl-[acyl-carrier-protein] reductase [Gammaproteobacteria bacterium GWE2_37_16]